MSVNSSFGMTKIDSQSQSTVDFGEVISQSVDGMMNHLDNYKDGIEPELSWTFVIGNPIHDGELEEIGNRMNAKSGNNDSLEATLGNLGLVLTRLTDEQNQTHTLIIHNRE